MKTLLLKLACAGALTMLAPIGPAIAQQPPAAPPPEVSTVKSAPSEMETNEAPVKFTSGVNLVPVTVVVRDLNGHAVGNLTKEDFRLLDNGKPQVISRFSVEKPGAPPVIEKENNEAEEPAKPGVVPVPPPPVIADHFVAYLFDDLNLNFADLSRARDAAGKIIADSLQPGDRIAIYTTSAQIMLEFTNDLDKLKETLLRLRPVTQPGFMPLDCPYISYFMADRIINLNDPDATRVVQMNYAACSGNTNAGGSEIQVLAQHALSVGEHTTELVSDTLQAVVRRVAGMPGQRSIILVSPGFIVTSSYHSHITDILNRAIRNNIVISGLDARGLWTPPIYDAAGSMPAGNAYVTSMYTSYMSEEQSAQSDILEELSHGTGGSLFQNNNDLKSGFQRLSASPEYIYVLGFTPATLKSDGKFHSLKVSLVNARNLTLQTRKGYYAPRREAGAAEQAKQEIEEAVFSREVMKDIPVAVHTQFFKTGDFEARLSVVAQVDAKALRYRKEAGRNVDTLTLVSAIFDVDGNYISGNEKKVDLKLKDETLEKKLDHGLNFKTNFDVKTGTYVVRVVIRDGDSELMAAQNSSVQIP